MTEQGSSAQSDNQFAVNVSESLMADFAMLRETPFYRIDKHTSSKASSKGSRNKFSPKTIDKLAQHIACRHYANVCFELSHLCWALTNNSVENALFNYFYIDEVVTAHAMQAYFTNTEHCQCPLTQASIDMQISESRAVLQLTIHQHSFSIHSTRANLLAALMEWLVSILPNVFDQAYEHLNGKGFNGIQSFALLLQKDIYGYLKAHLPPAKSQSKFLQMTQWLKSQDRNDFDDEGVFQFWQFCAGKEGAEKLTTLTRDVLQFEQAIQSTRARSAISYAEDADTQVLAEEIFEIVDSYVQQTIDVEALCDTPKLLSKQQAHRLSLIADFPELCLRFPLTVVRYDVFGAVQAKCIQAQRNKKLDATLFSPIQENQYWDFVQKLMAQKELNRLNFYAVLHIFLLQREERVSTSQVASEIDEVCIELLAANNEVLNEFAKEADIAIDIGKGKNALDAPQLSITQAQIIEHILQTPALIKACKKAYQQNNRQGFTDATRLKNNQDYVDGILLLIDLSKVLARFIHTNMHLFSSTSVLNEKYRADGFIFSDELRRRMME
jgi:hypothetical protein